MYNTFEAIFKLSYTAFALFVLYKVLEWFISYCRMIWYYRTIPQRQFLPFIGNMHLITFSKTGMTEDAILWTKLFKKYPYFIAWLGPVPFISFAKSDFIEVYFRN